MTFHAKLIAYKKLLRIRFDKAHGFIKIHGGTRYLVLFCLGWLMQFIIELDIL